MIHHLPIIDPIVLDERLKAIEEGIKSLKNPSDHVPRNEWLSLEDFKKATGIKSHYYINKMKLVGKEKKNEFKAKILGKKLFIHESEIEKYFDGFYQ